MRTYYKLSVLRTEAERLIHQWRNQGWEPTIITVYEVSCVVILDMVTDKNTDPTNHRGVLATFR